MTDFSLPVTVLCGFAGAGKSTVSACLAAHLPQRRIARLDDADPSSAIRALAQAHSSDAVIVELPCWADPISFVEPFIEAFFDETDPNAEASAHDVPPAHIDTVVTVIDASRFLSDLASSDSLAERGITTAHDDDRTVGEVIIDQVEFCDVLVINQIDRTDAATIDRLRHLLAKINPRAQQIVTQFGQVSGDALVDAGLFDFEAAASAPGWLVALDHDASALVHNDAAGAGMLVYRARRPFHPARFFALLHEEWKGVLRSKGYFWIASRNDMAGTLSQAGGTCRHGPAGYWWVAQPADEWPEDEAFRAEIAHDWLSSLDANGQETVGDRRQEIVMIGFELDRNAWRHKLDACLLDDAEFHGGPQAWAAIEDPFPQWDEDHDHDHDDGHDHDHTHDHDHDHGHNHNH